MKYDLFVTEDDFISESFYVVKHEGEFYYGDNLEEVKKNYLEYLTDSLKEFDEKEYDEKVSNIIKQETLEKIEVTFKRPDFNTNTYILGRCISPSSDLTDNVFDVVEFTKLRLYFLLKDWNIEHNGEKVEVIPENISALHPTLVEAILKKLNKCVKAYKLM